MILGTSPGRSGSKSLAKLLGISFEIAALDWVEEGGDVGGLGDLVDLAIDDVAERGGDVGVYWLPLIDRVLERYPETRIVYLERDFQATVRSWLKKIEGRGGRHTLPGLQGVPPQIAAPLWVGNFRERARAACDRHPDQVRRFRSPDVFTRAGDQSRLLLWVGLDQEIDLSIWENRGQP